eukprot:GILJ01015923.1.p1 GENE.GILJ01015923.1~~GILJ01015923.1.p1  ORF type:complete len:1520 (-),score=259.96 GILJ01015923.1:186-4409(-)
MAAALHHPSRQHTADTLSPGLGPKQAPTMEMGDLFAADADGNGMMGSPTPSTDVTSGSVNSKPPLNSAPNSGGGQSVKLAAEAPTAPQSVNLHPVHISFGTPVHSMEMMYHGGASDGATTASFGPTGESQDGVMIHHTTQPPTPSPKVAAEKSHTPPRHHETRSHEQHQAPPVTQGIQMFPEAAAKSTEERRQVKTKFSPTTASPAATAGSFTDNLQPQTSSSRYRASALGIKEGSQAIGCTSSSSSDSDDDEKAQRKDAKRKSAKHHIRQPDGGLSRRRQHKGNVASSLYVDPVSGNAAPQSELLPIATEADGGDDLILGAVTQQPGSSATAESQPTGANLFKSFATALCVIPPPKLCSHIDIIRTSYDKAYTRWMPHLTILYPFVHPAKFADAIPLLQNALSKLPPFRVTLRKLAILNEDDPAAKKHVIYIVPEVKTECLMRLQAVVQKIFPQCVRPAMHGQEINADGFPQFRPHITVGQIPSNSPKERTEIFEWFKKHWQNQEFTVSQLHVVMENNTTSGANAAPASTGNAAGAYDSESRGSQSSESEGGSPQKKVSTGKGASDKKSRNNSPDRTPNIGPKREEPAATDATRRNRKGHRHNNTYISYDEIGDGAAEESNYESEGANKTRKEMKAEKRAKKSVSRHAAAANKKLTRPEKREGIFEVVHTVQLQGEADFMSTSAAQTPKPTPQAPPRMEDLMPLPDLELPPPTVTSDSKNDIKSSSNLLSASDVLKSIVSTSSGEAFPPLDSRSDGLQQSPVWGGVEHFPQVESTSTNPPAPSPNNTTFAAKPDDSLTAVTDGPAHSISGKSAAMSPHNEGQDRPTTVAATPSAGNLAAALSPSALVAAVANSSVLPMATGLASDSLLPLMVMEESRTTEVYEPTDALERWLATHSDRTLARAYPTHTSQKGGMYHISAIDMKGFMEEWQVALLASDAALAAKYGSAPRSAPSSASDNTGSSAAAAVPQPTAPIPFFIEEVRTKQYRLYVDIDMVVCGQSEEDGLGIGSDSLSTSQSPMLGSSVGSAAKTYLGVATAAAGVLPSPQASPQSTSLLANTTTSSSAGQTPTSGQPGDSPSTSTALSPSTTITSSYRDLLRQICIVTQQMFGVSDDDSAALVLYSHGPWPSTPKEPTIIAKTGYRLYFQRIFVDQPTHRRYLTRLAEVIRRTLGAVPPTCPQGTTWSDIIGDQCAVWDRTRLLGTVKLRRNLQRQYKYIGIFDSQHPESNGRNQELSQLYSKDVKRLMFGQMIRVWDANVRLPKPNNMLGAFNRTKAIPTTITNDAVSDDDSEPPALYLGPTEGSNKKGSKGGRPHGFFGIRKGSGCKRRGTLKPIESDEETHFLQQQRSDPRDDSASKACVVTPVVRPLKPSDPSKDVVVDNCFRMDRYFTALEGLERAAASSPTSPK